MHTPIHWPRSYSVPRGLTLRLGGPRLALAVARLHYLALSADDLGGWVPVAALCDRLRWLERRDVEQLVVSLERLGVVSTRQHEGQGQARLNYQRLDMLPPKHLGRRQG